jgi:hypothetical protein
MSVAIACVQRKVEKRGHHNAAEGADDRQRRLARRSELADEQFAFDLEADDEKENRHQSVIDPMQDRLRQREALEANGKLVLPERGITLRPWRVCPCERQRRRRQ